MEKHIYFVRHGESEENQSGIHIGPNAGLTDTGRKQAHTVAKRIERIGVDALISSPFIRARDTAISIAERTGLAIEVNEHLGEWIEPSHLIGLHIDDPVRKSVRAAIRAVTDNPDFRHSDEETFSELLSRARVTIRALEEHSAERICVVTHGGFLRAVVGEMLFGSGFTKKDFIGLINNLITTNTGVTYARYTEAYPRWQLITWNDQSHLG